MTDQERIAQLAAEQSARDRQAGASAPSTWQQEKEGHGMSQKHGKEGTGHERHLPRVRTSYSYIMRGAALVLALCVIGLPVYFASGGESDSGVAALLIVGEMFSLVFLVVAALFARTTKKAIPRILKDPLTVHWTYSPTDWQRFTTQAWRRSLRHTLITTGILWGIALVVVLILFATAQGVFNLAAGGAVGTAVVAGLGLLLFLLDALSLWARRRHRTSDAYLNWEGVILSGWFYPMRGPKKVTYKEGNPAILHYDVGSGRSSYQLAVPVPHGCEAEAERLARRRL